MVSGKKIVLMGLAIFLAAYAQAQVNRYMVFFKDKANTTYSTSAPLDFLSQRAIDRRIKQGITVTSQDFPVNPGYIQGVAGTGADVFFTTRWLNGALVQCDQALIPAIQALAFVDRVEKVAPNEQLAKNGRKRTLQKKKNNTSGLQTQNQLSMLGIPDMHASGYTGEGLIVAIFDSGFEGVSTNPPFQHLVDGNKINLNVSKDFVYNSGDVFQYDDHGTEVFSVIAAQVPDEFTGGAYGATFQLYVTEDVPTEYRIEEYNWLFAAERADSAGVDIIQSSLGYYDFDDATMNYSKAQMDGKTAVVTRAAQWAADRGMLVVCSAGNEGNIASWKIITAPADAKDVIAVASVDLSGKRSSSSSIGPAADNRIKPDLAALGVGVRVINGAGAFSSSSGTSLAAPLITSLAAGVWQRFPYLSNKELIGLLKYTASQSANPDNLLGYGIPNFTGLEKFQVSQEKEVFRVFPNPVLDTITISPINPGAVSACRVELISSLGQKVGEANVAFDILNSKYNADISHLASGMYYLRVWIGSHRYLFKVVKQ